FRFATNSLVDLRVRACRRNAADVWVLSEPVARELTQLTLGTRECVPDSLVPTEERGNRSLPALRKCRLLVLASQVAPSNDPLASMPDRPRKPASGPALLGVIAFARTSPTA